ncbi:hypothetical protein [Marinobacterium sp. xm-d-530]|uniref:hypothetical protein n=1 Tax=Marinobacterium sp. xm-d-530 TaxID=2497747 RepID=UPI0015691B23|nr:hypothetical protein [Marinobacterium sp. xm-d-530]NRQ00830.1 hypothetical protein [Marinobacterium sp. xm-d-530]
MLTYFLIFLAVGAVIALILRSKKSAYVLMLVIGLLWGVLSGIQWGALSFFEMLIGHSILNALLNIREGNESLPKTEIDSFSLENTASTLADMMTMTKGLGGYQISDTEALALAKRCVDFAHRKSPEIMDANISPFVKAQFSCVLYLELNKLDSDLEGCLNRSATFLSVNMIDLLNDGVSQAEAKLLARIGGAMSGDEKLSDYII